MVKKKDSYFDPDAPAWARYNGESYTSSFSGTARQKREHEKALAEFFAGRHKRKGKHKEKNRHTSRSR